MPARSQRFLRVTALAALCALAGCEPYVEGNGVLREEPRTVGAFSGVSFTDGIQGSVTAGAAEPSVVVRGDENVLQYVSTVVEDRPPHGSVLVVRADSAYQSRNALLVTVRVPALSYVAASDASPVAVTGAAAPAFTVDASDGSNVTLAGAGGARIDVTLGGGQHGGARLDARGYEVGEAHVALAGGAVASLRATAAVSGTAAGAGTRVENAGAGACAVTATDGAQVSCPAP